MGSGPSAVSIVPWCSPGAACDTPWRVGARSLGMAAGRTGLGRGLGALIPGGGGVDEVDIDLIAPNPEQPRARIDPAALAELAASVREHGLLQPLVVTRQ